MAGMLLLTKIGYWNTLFAHLQNYYYDVVVVVERKS